MASPAYITITDEQGKQVRAKVNIRGREGTAEALAFDYYVSIPADANTGQLTSVRKHGVAQITKTYDRASPILFDVCCRGATLQKVCIDWYRINDRGEEENYFSHVLSGVKVVKFHQHMAHVKQAENDEVDHQETVSFRFRKIELIHPEGNIKAVDEWVESRGRKMRD